MRNSLIILTKILPHYPKLSAFSAALEKRVEKLKISERDKRQDIFTLASAYLGQLKQRKATMCDESKFHMKETQNTSEIDKAKAKAPQPVAANQPIQQSFKQPNNPKQSVTIGELSLLFMKIMKII